MSIRTQAPTPFLSEEVAERVLALPTPPPSPLSPYSSPLPQIPSPPLPIPPPSPISPTYAEGSLGSRAAGQTRDALPVGESSAAGAARQFGPTTTEADLYGFVDMLDAAPGRQMSRECRLCTSRACRLRIRHGLQQSEILRLTGSRPEGDRTVDFRNSKNRLSSADSSLAETLKIVKSLKAQMTELQRQQGPAKDPAEPEEAGSSS
ncbi:hypothetical protein Tco_1134522 [Tanacetum coccineum]